jgi:dihydrolipoamide dehydrogenase
MTESYDVAIIGAGTAGLSALREVRKQTDNFVIINDGPYGTTCARVGCMPSKALVESAKTFHRRLHFDTLGIHGATELRIDVPAVLRRIRVLRDEFVAGTRQITDDLGARSLSGRARFIAPDVLDVNGRHLRARTIIVATGSRPMVPERWRWLGSRLLTSNELFEQSDLPRRMVVIGLGAVGAEIGQALARLGLEVVAFGAGPCIAGLTDPVVSAAAIHTLSKEFPLFMDTRAELHPQGEQVLVRAGAHSFVVDAVFAALGRQPNIDDLGFEHLGVQLDEHGLPPINRHSMQIADLPIYIAGDASDALPLMHEASDEGHIGGYNATQAKPACFQRRTPLVIVFSDPNIATVGTPFADLDPQQIAIGSVDFSRQGRARVACENQGLLRVYANRVDGLLVGAELCAPSGEHLAHLLALAIEQRMSVAQLLRMPFYHPVLEEGLRTALRDVSRKLGSTATSDLANCDPIGAVALD